MAHDTSIIEAMRRDGENDSYSHWWDDARDVLEEAARAVLKNPKVLEARAIKATDNFMDSMVAQAQQAWKSSTSEPSIGCPVEGCGGHEPQGSTLEGWAAN